MVDLSIFLVNVYQREKTADRSIRWLMLVNIQLILMVIIWLMILNNMVYQ